MWFIDAHRRVAWCLDADMHTQAPRFTRSPCRATPRRRAPVAPCTSTRSSKASRSDNRTVVATRTYTDPCKTRQPHVPPWGSSCSTRAMGGSSARRPLMRPPLCAHVARQGANKLGRRPVRGAGAQAHITKKMTMSAGLPCQNILFFQLPDWAPRRSHAVPAALGQHHQPGQAWQDRVCPHGSRRLLPGRGDPRQRLLPRRGGAG